MKDNQSITGRKKIVLIGGSGVVGHNLERELATLYEIVIIDISEPEDRNNNNYIKANIANMDQLMNAIPDDAYALVNLACLPWQPPIVDKDAIRRSSDTYIIGAYNVFLAAAKKGIGKVVFASSIHVTGAYEAEGKSLLGRKITTDDYPLSVSAYGAMKLCAEQFGYLFHKEKNISVICLRMGGVKEDELSLLREDKRAHQVILSKRDTVEIFHKAINTDVKYGVYYAVSDNPGRPWDISDTIDELGFNPQINSADLFKSGMDDIHKILKCPASDEPLRPVQAEELTRLNSKVRQGALYHRDGSQVTLEIQGGYITQSGRLVYAIREGIIVLLSNLAIVLDNEHVAVEQKRIISQETNQVQAFDDQTGWQKTEDGKYEDTARFVDDRPVLYSYFSKCNKRIINHMKKKGKYLVDVACGPIHYDSYRALSDGYDYRICIDVSFQALREAKKQMKDKGVYLMADITNMPLQDQSVDDVISLHTLYHVPADRQITALNEIHRVLKPDSKGVVIYSWGDQSLLMRGALLPVGLFKSMRALPERNNGSRTMDKPQLYYHTHDYHYLMNGPVDFDMDVVVWSSISSAFTKTYIPEGLIGALLLKIIGKLEGYFPHASGRFGQYPLFVIKK